jgi:DNA-directed RNA polymerase subunit M/transcription elongation factor TFIIS
MRLNADRTTKANKVSNECAQCGEMLIAAVWSEHLSERCIRHLWNCDACGYAYETKIYFASEVTIQHALDTAA